MGDIFTQIFSATIVLFAIIDILGSTPIILNFQSRGIVVKPMQTTLVSLGIMLLFLFAGDWVLQLFHVTIEAFAVAGAFILFFMALEMILDVEIFKNNGPKEVSSIVPLAFPLVAGPGSFVTLVALRAEFPLWVLVVALLLNLIFVYAVLVATDPIRRFFGAGGIYIMRKFFGVILMAIAVRLFATNLHAVLHSDETKPVEEEVPTAVVTPEAQSAATIALSDADTAASETLTDDTAGSTESAN